MLDRLQDVEVSPDGEAGALASALACCTDILGTCQAQHKALARSSQSLHTGPSGPRDRELPFVIADRGKAGLMVAEPRL